MVEGMIRFFMSMVLVSCLALAGCGTSGEAPAVGPSASADDSSSTTSSKAPVDKAALVNGQLVPMSDLHALLVEAYGEYGINQIIASTVVRQRAAEEGVAVTDADVEAETNATLEDMAGQLNPAEQRQVLQRVLQQRNYPEVFWRMSMRRNAALRKMAMARLKITPEMLTEEFNDVYGLKVRIRHIQSASVDDARKILDRLAAGESFEQLARDYSINTRTAQNGGLLAPFSRDNREIPAAIRREAFDLADGQVSEIIQVDRDFHVIKREESIAPTTSVTFEDVKDQLRQRIISRKIRPLQSQLLQELLNGADIVLVDPTLKRQARTRQAEPLW